MLPPVSEPTAGPDSPEISPYEPPQAPPPVPVARPLSPWGVFGYTVLLFIGYSIVQLVVGLVTLLVVGLAGGQQPNTALAMPLGLLVSAGTVVAAPVFVLATIYLTRYRVQEPARDFLGLRWPSFKQALLWTLALAATSVLYEILGRWLERPEIPPFMRDIFTGPGPRWLLWLAVVVAAPVVEEFFFRGFLLEGLRRARLGNLAAVAISSVLFAVIHGQYDLFDMTAVLTLGALLAFARIASGSLYLVIALHALNNLVSMAVTTSYLQQGGG